MVLPAHVLFTFEKVTKLEPNKTVLVGDVTFDRNQINGDGIIIDFIRVGLNITKEVTDMPTTWK